MNCIGFPNYDQQIAQPKAMNHSQTEPRQLLGNLVAVKREPIDENEHPEQLLGKGLLLLVRRHILTCCII